MSDPLEEADRAMLAAMGYDPDELCGVEPDRAAIQAYLRARADAASDLYLVLHEIELLAAELDQPAETAGEHE